jgi:hypothetical protein
LTVQDQEVQVLDVVVPVPFIVMSTMISPWGEVQRHVLTPFGDVDITVTVASMRELEGPVLDVRVEPGAGWPMLLNPGIPAFWQALVKFVGAMVQEILGGGSTEVGELRIEFPGFDQAIVKL